MTNKGSDMSFEEKSTWIYGVLSAVVSAVYFAILLVQIRRIPVSEIAYEWLMVAAVGVAVALSVGSHIVIAVASKKEANKRDERDADIGRYGESIGGYVLAFGAVSALVLAMARFEHFWIANAIYLAFVLQAITSSAFKAVAYRRGF